MRRADQFRSVALFLGAFLLLASPNAGAALAQLQPGVSGAETEALPSQAPPSDTASFTITSVSIPLSSDIELHGRLYRPTVDTAVATIFSMTPYTADDAHEYGTAFARHGYAYLNVDVRGRGGSDGTFRPLIQDGPDGAAVVDWIARQPWSDGRVAMRGGSYRGMVQWQILGEGAEPLRTVVPTASAYPGWDFPNEYGIFGSYAARWLSLVQGRASQGSLFGDEAYWDAKFETLHRRGAAFEKLDDLTGISSRIFKEWIQHPHLDDYWTAPSPDPDDYRRFDRFHWTSRQLQAGSRLRLVIAPLNTPSAQKNYHSGAPPMQETVEDAQTATITLHMTPDRQSALTLPVRSDSAP